MMLKKSLLACLLTVSTIALVCTALAGDEPVITTGSPAGTYFNEFGPRIRTVLDKLRFPHQVVTSAGSGENFARVCDNPHNIGLEQADVLPALMAGRPDCKIVVTDTIANECVFGVSKLRELKNVDQLAKISFNLRVAIPGKGSGSALTWANIVKTIPALADAEVVTAKDTADAVAMVQNGRADVAVFVAFPDPGNAIFMAINDAHLSFVDMSSWDLLQQTVAGSDAYVYDRLGVVVKNAGLKFWNGPTEVETACTKTVVITGDPASTNLPKGTRFQQALIRLLKDTDPAQMRPDVGWLTSFMNKAATMSRETMQAAAKKAAEYAKENPLTR